MTEGIPAATTAAGTAWPTTDDPMTLDANAVAGMLQDAFGAEMTAAPGQCAHCGNVAPLGTLIAYTRAPGVVLRCSVCAEVVIRIVETPDSMLVDARGAVYLRRSRRG
jgi:Family of unknown function (DUF6510)